MKKYFLIVLLMKTIFCDETENYIPEDYIDFRSMLNYDRETKSMKLKQPISENNPYSNAFYESSHVDNASLIKENKRYLVFIERFINRILQSANLKDYVLKPGSKIVTEIPVSITAEELSQLSAIGNDFKSSDLKRAEELISVVFSHNRGFTFDSLVSHFNPLQQLFFDMSMERLVVLIGLSIAVVVVWMFIIRESIKRIMIFLFLMSFMGGMAFNGWHMYKEMVAEQFSHKKKIMNIPDVCDPKSSSMFSWISSIFTVQDECKEFYRLMEIDPLSKVPFSVVFSHTISTMFIHPLKDLGIGFGDFLRGVSNAAPWPFNHIFLPFVMIVTYVALIFIVLMKLGISFKLWTFFGGVSMSPEKNKTENTGLVDEFKSLKRSLDKRIEDIQLELLDNKLKINYQRSNSIATCSSKDVQINDHGEESSQSVTSEETIAFPSSKFFSKQQQFLIPRYRGQKAIFKKKFK